jgi:hypothetical protein
MNYTCCSLRAVRIAAIVTFILFAASCIQSATEVGRGAHTALGELTLDDLIVITKQTDATDHAREYCGNYSNTVFTSAVA